MADLQKRGGYTPRRVREQRAYRLVLVGGGAGALGVLTLILSIAGVMGLGIPIILLIVSAVCLLGFRGMVQGK